ncbi:MAG: CHAP domain-containing protein [Archangiaceae bacterium]|nr:CHAP domain-containing protein [Archangiaceae bacterium]
MRRLLTAAPACVALVACATGSPLGARSTWSEGEWHSFSPAVQAREVPKEEPATQPLKLPNGARDKTVRAARLLVGVETVDMKGRPYPDDCSGLVRTVFDRVGVNLLSVARPEDNAVTAIYRWAQKYGRVYTGGRPVAGDLVFYRDTYDLNRDGRENDGLTHIGVVDDVDEDGTVTVIHRVHGGVRKYRMNLNHPNLSRSTDGRTLNDWLRLAGRTGKAQLTSDLFMAYATVLPVEPKYTAQREVPVKTSGGTVVGEP